MNQSSVIGAALVIAYVIFVITKGELPCYMQVLGISTAAGCPQPLQPAGCTGATATSSGSTTGAAGTTTAPPAGAPTGGTQSGGRNLGGIGIGIPRITLPGETGISVQSY